MPLLDLNLNLAGPGASTGAASRFRPRYNTDIFARLIDTTKDVVPGPRPGTPARVAPPAEVTPAHNYFEFHRYWDADLRACEYLREFEVGVPNWFDNYRQLGALNKVPGVNMLRVEMQQQVLGILDLALERDDRYAEVIDQDDADGAMNYWLGMLKIDPARHPATNLLVRVGRRIGEHVSMCLKGYFLAPRPPQLSPAIVPMIDPPATPSFPAGHAVQSYLISYLLAYSLRNFPQQQNPLPNPPGYPAVQASGLLFELAHRVAENRIVAGIHYPIDIQAGIAVAIACFNDLNNLASVQSLMTDVGTEFPQYA